MVTLSRLEEIRDLRTVWPHEALDFTPWLAQDENMALLSDAIEIDMTVDEIESCVGDFNVDIFASETGTDRTIIIENQLEDTDHDHLGKLITYASGKSADVIVWLVKRAREEHRAAVEWLNNHTDENIGFFLCEIKLFRIGSSDPAVKFEVVERPNEVKKATSPDEGQQLRYDYWAAFQDYAFQDTRFSRSFHRGKPSKEYWMSFGIGSSQCHIEASQVHKRSELSVQLYIDQDKDLFRSLYAMRETIEADAGLSFDWRELPNRKASRIVANKNVSFDDRAQWTEHFNWMIDLRSRISDQVSAHRRVQPPAAHRHRGRCCRRRATRYAHRELVRWSQRAGGHVSDPHCRGEHDPRQRRYLHSHRRAPALRGEALVDTGGLLPAGPPAHRHCTHLRRRQRLPLPRQRARQPVLRVLIDLDELWIPS